MQNEWNPQNVVKKLLTKQQFYIINSVLTRKVLDVDELNGNVLFLNNRLKGKASQQFSLVKENDGYLIECKSGGFVTRFKEGKQQKLYLDKKLANPSDQLFRISSKIGLKGERIETLDKRAMGTQGKQNAKESWEEVVLLDENSEENELWNFSDVKGE